MEITLRVSKRNFASTVRVVDNSRLFPATPKLVQWDFTYRGTTSYGPCFVSSFRSVVQRHGMSGWWLDMPYFCASGPHHYRKLPLSVTAKLNVAILRGRIDRAADALRDNVNDANRACWRLWHKYNPHTLLAARKERREWAKLGIDL